MSIKIDFAQKVRAVRLEKGLATEELALRLAWVVSKERLTPREELEAPRSVWSDPRKSVDLKEVTELFSSIQRGEQYSTGYLVDMVKKALGIEADLMAELLEDTRMRYRMSHDLRKTDCGVEIVALVPVPDSVEVQTEEFACV